MIRLCQSFPRALAWAVLLVSLVHAQRSLTVVRPGRGQVISTNSLLIEVECDLAGDSVVRLDFVTSFYAAGYQPVDFTSFYQQVVDSVLHTTRAPPFQWIWDISGIQDQYHSRMMVGAIAYTARGDTLRAVSSDFVVDRHTDPSPRSALVCPRGANGRGAGIDPRVPAAEFANSDNTVGFQAWWSPETGRVWPTTPA